jgi:hypothetical protein
MASSTRKQRAIKFSALEEELIRLLPRDGTRVSTTALVDRYYAATAPDSVPDNPRQTLVSRLRGIARKAERGALPWRVCKTKRAGPHPQEFWIKAA